MNNFKLIGKMDVKVLRALCGRTMFQDLRAASGMTLEAVTTAKKPLVIRSVGGAHDDSKAVYLRYTSKIDPTLVNDSFEVKDSPLYSRPWRQAVGEISKAVGLLPARALIIKLRAQGKILEHVDRGAYFDRTDRYHLVLQTNEGATLTSGGETAHMAEGELWYFNDHVPHGGENRGWISRIHLVVDFWRS